MTQTTQMTNWLQSLVDTYTNTRVGTIELGDMHGLGEGVTAALDLVDFTAYAEDESLAYPVLVLDICADDHTQIATLLQIGWWDDEAGMSDAVPMHITPATTVATLSQWFTQHAPNFEVTPEQFEIAMAALPDFLQLAHDALQGPA